MKSLILCLVAALGTSGILQAMPIPATPVPPAETGKVLVLDNDLLIEGEILRVGNEYSVRKGAVGETLIPANRVVKLVQTKAEAYEVLKSRSNSRDPDEHVRLARWGLVHQMFPEALQEAELALAMRPNDSQAKVLASGLKKLIERPIEPANPEPKVTVPAESEEVGLPSGFNANTFGTYASKIQPMLMNLCASCHATGKGGNYKLTRVFGATSNRKGTLTNLAATLNQIAREKPQQSPLLVKSITAHGEPAKQCIKDNQSPPYRLLESWVTSAFNPEDHPKAESGNVVSKPIFIEPEKATEPMTNLQPKRLNPPPLIATQTPSKIEESPMPKESSFGDLPKPMKKETEPKDEFDPMIFNKQVPKK